MQDATFKQQMDRLDAAFGQKPNGARYQEYWSRLKNQDGALFGLAVDRLIDEADRFPTVKMIHAAYYAIRDEQAAKWGTARRPEDAMREAAVRNAATLAGALLPSEYMLDEGTTAGMTPVRYRPGSRDHTDWLRRFEQLDNALAVRLQERIDEIGVRPDDPDLERRIGVLDRESRFSHERLEHFKRTGEVLRHPATPPRGSPVRHSAELVQCSTCGATEDAPTHFVRVDVSPGSRHFGGSRDGQKQTPIPCPTCRPQGYAAYVKAFGQPSGMPWPEATT